VNVILKPMQTCGAVWSNTRYQRSEIGGGRESEERQVQIYEGEEVGFVLFGAAFVFFEVAVVEAGVRGVEGWLCCIGDGLIDQFAGLNDVFVKGKTQSVGDLRF